MQTSPIAMEVVETTITANLAIWKLPAPSSFDTLTLFVLQHHIVGKFGTSLVVPQSQQVTKR